MREEQWWEQDPLPKFIEDVDGNIYEHVYDDIYRTRSGRVATISYLNDFMSPITVLGDEPPEHWRSESDDGPRFEACSLDW